MRQRLPNEGGTSMNFLGLYRTPPGCSHIGGKLPEAHTGLAGDVALAAAAVGVAVTDPQGARSAGFCTGRLLSFVFNSRRFY